MSSKGASILLEWLANKCDEPTRGGQVEEGYQRIKNTLGVLASIAALIV